jgi:hypothetical protein
MSYTKLLDLMNEVPEDERELISAGYAYQGSYCVIGLCCPSSRNCPPVVVRQLYGEARKLIDMEMAALGLTLEEVTVLQAINDTVDIDATDVTAEEARTKRWQRVYNFVRTEASKE